MGLYATAEAGKAAGVAAIKAAVNARITTLPDGSLALNTASLAEWLAVEANKIIDEDVDGGANQSAARDALRTINTTGDVAQLARFISKDNWVTRQDYPSLTTIITGQSFVVAASTMIGEMNLAASQIEAKYRKLIEQVPDILSETYLSLDVEAGLPEVVTRLVDTRFYVYTYVNDLGWESAPSPVSAMVETDQFSSVTITIPAAPTGYFIEKWRFYRSNVGTVGAAFQFLDEGPIATLTGVDNARSAQLGEVIPSTTWLPAPADLKGLVGAANGVFAGYTGNTVAFCEPYYPYAWPVEYQITTESPIVALGVFGQTIVVFHRRGVDYISGADSASMSRQQNVSEQTCVSPRSVVNVEGGVVFASPDGICIATSQGVKNLTEGKVLREDWQTLTLANVFCAYTESTVYLRSWIPGDGGAFYALHLPTNRLTVVVPAVPYTAAYQDRMLDAIYAANGTQVYKLFAGPNFKTGTWRSKIAVMPKHTGFAWLSIESDFTAPITVRWYGDGALQHTSTVSSREPVRLPAGRWLEHEIEVESTARWSRLTMASSGDELRAA